MEVLGHYLDALGPFLKHFPAAVGSVINKLFELLNSLPFVVKVVCNFYLSFSVSNPCKENRKRHGI